MHLTPVRTLDELEDFQAVEEASFAHHFVGLPADPIDEQVPLLDGQPRAGRLTRLYVGRTADGVPVGTLTLTLPLLDNLVTANVDGSVHPDHLRQGLGRALLHHAIDLVRAEGRSRLFLEAPWRPDGSPGPAFGFLREAGARPVLDDLRRILDLRAHPPGPLPAVPDGYRLEQWLDTAPAALVDGCAYLMGRMTLDAPMGEMDYEQERWDAERYRAAERDAMGRGRLRVSSAVIHEPSGAVAGITDIGLNRKRPEVAYQWDTIVDPEHRGRRLGLLLKAANHRFLLEHVPTVRWINTWNAASNTFMIAVNEALGFEVAERWSEWQLDL